MNTDKQPKYQAGERVTLTGDKHSRPWTVLTQTPSGTVRIHRTGRPITPQTTMTALPTNLTRHGKDSQP